MKLTEFITKLQMLANDHPDAGLRLQWVEYTGIGTNSMDAELVALEFSDSCATIRIAREGLADQVRRLSANA